ncbi:hypothetical protein BpHYR1_000264 [Brachionus plicatilis]|uniref:Uncharacterized protein n=1 Tax=Brachionus plicatilis TaxID=10195 RepID=A0A3M7QEH4_BRAPC|nr:hypothetical protein BpHYR1_000264 [Brachionus plicatilis]
MCCSMFILLKKPKIISWVKISTDAISSFSNVSLLACLLIRPSYIRHHPVPLLLMHPHILAEPPPCKVGTTKLGSNPYNVKSKKYVFYINLKVTGVVEIWDLIVLITFPQVQNPYPSHFLNLSSYSWLFNEARHRDSEFESNFYLEQSNFFKIL